MKRVLLLIFLLAPFLAFTQSKLFGVVRDMSSNVSYANVVLTDTEGKIITHDVTDDNGYFEITVKNGVYIIKITYVGFDTWERHLEISKNTDLGIISLKENSEKLDQVEITSYRNLVKRKEGKIHFNVKDSPFKEGYEAIDILRISPQVLVDIEGNISLPQGTPKVFINGREVKLSGKDLANYLAAIDSKNIVRVEVDVNSSAKNAATGNNGTINIVLKEFPVGISSTFQGRLWYKDENNIDKYIGNSTLFGSKKWNGYLISDYGKSFNETKNTLINEYDSGDILNNKSIANINSDFIRFKSGLLFYPSKKLTFGIDGFYSNYRSNNNDNGLINLFQNSQESVSSNILNSEDKYDYWNATIDISYDLDTLGSKVKFVGEIGDKKYDNHNILDINDVVNEYSEKNITNSNSDSKFSEFRLDWNQKLKNNFEFSLGSNYSNIDRFNLLDVNVSYDNHIFFNDENEDYENKETILANYFTINKTHKKHYFDLGLRIESTDIKGIDKIQNNEIKQKYTDFFPTLNYSYQISNYKNLSFGASRGIQRASFFDLNPYVIKINDKNYLEGNPNLRPSYNYTLNLSYNYKKHSFSFYFKNIDDIIAPFSRNVGEDIIVTRPENLNTNRTYTLNYTFSGKIHPKIFVNFKNNFFYTEQEIGNELYETPGITSNLLVYYFMNKKTTFYITNKFASKYRTGILLESAFDRFSIGLKRKMFKNKGVLTLTLYDVFDTFRTETNADYGTFSQYSHSKSLTRSFVVHFKYTFSSKKKFKNKKIQHNSGFEGRL
ncbi:outer membrane beta-barrel family protein [Aureivirga marina]|uniref:outer membrane beta-barrel family protein n=1 Tax=Aureivirga marina TaxID=1182451 RepID=UPI0018CBB743|nr:outer membrane beta-barrel family protein [Aureivirga marina]